MNHFESSQPGRSSSVERRDNMSDSELIDVPLDHLNDCHEVEPIDHKIYSAVGTTPAKNAKCLPVYVVEYHHHALQHIHRNIARKKLRFEANTMIHFDSHPDLCFPRPFDPDRIFEKDYVYDNVNIESWILPLAYAGHLSDVVWVRAPWSDQIEDGLYKFKIGNDFNEVKLTIPADYFVSECIWAPEESLSNTKPCSLHVSTIENLDLQALEKAPEGSGDAIKEHWSTSWILDIDLDYFSTKNPFENIFSDKQLAIMRKLYDFPPLPKNMSADRLKEISQKRRNQLDDLQIIIGANLHNSHHESTEHDTDDSEREKLVAELISDLDENPPHDHVVTPELIHDAGCTMDLRSMLPHHVSTQHEVETMISTIEASLSKIPEKPKVVTISRSSTDDYCPKQDVNFIQEQVLSMVQRLYGDCTVMMDYDDKPIHHE